LLSYDIKTLREDAQLAEMYIIALQYRSRARILQAKSFFDVNSFFANFGK